MIIAIAIFLAAAFVISAIGFVSFASRYNTGVVTGISVKEKSDNSVELRLKYLLGTGGYSVRMVSEDEPEHTGNGERDYDGALGKYRICVEFGEAALKESLKNKMDENGVIQLSDDLRGRVAFSADHGFVLYVGCDQPMHLEEQNGISLNAFSGTVRIPVTVNK